MIHVFHGFLGSPADFSFLKGDQVLLHDLYADDFNPQVGSDDILIGYSMGGRYALELAHQLNFKVKKVVLLASHPGLKTPEEKDKRKAWENDILHKMETLSAEEFFTYWNALPVFQFDHPLKAISPERYDQSKKLFDRMRLSLQPNYLLDIEQYPEKFLWLIGLQDEKYLALAEDELLPRDIEVKGIEAGHRLFQQPEAVKTILMEEGIL